MRFRPPALLAALAALSVLAGLTACSAPPPPPALIGIAFVLGAHANQPQYDAGDLAAALDDAVVEGATIAVVTDEGSPRLVYKATIGDLANNPATRAEQVAAVRAGLAEAISSATAVTPESNSLEAIAQAADALRDVPGERRIVVTSSLLQTTGALNFTRGLLDAEPGDVVEALDGALPPLTGIDVELLAVGQSALPQAPLDSRARANLSRIWADVLTQAGAQVNVTGTQVGTPPAADLPAVTPVELAAAAAPVVATGCRAVVPDARVAFAPDSADLLDPAAAQAVIADVAQQIGACEGTVRILGTTSSAGTEEGRARVSAARAAAVAELLAQALGRDVAGFDVRGLGYDTAEGECVVDRVDGRLSEELMTANRKTLVVVGRTGLALTASAGRSTEQRRLPTHERTPP